MSSPAQIVANRENSQHSTGPRTAAGKEKSSRNALASGLFAGRDFVRPEEREEYEATRAGLWSEIHPEGVIEETLASSVLAAAWRLRRCGLVEAELAERSFTDPMQADPADPAGAVRIQTSVDRARSQAHTLLRRSLADLRRLKTDRTIRRALFFREDPPAPDLTSYKEVVAALNADERGRRLVFRNWLDRNLTSAAPVPASGPEPLASNCKAPAVARGAACPCGSGAKYKRCCGREAAPVLHRAA